MRRSRTLSPRRSRLFLAISFAVPSVNRAGKSTVKVCASKYATTPCEAGREPGQGMAVPSGAPCPVPASHGRRRRSPGREPGNHCGRAARSARHAQQRFEGRSSMRRAPHSRNRIVGLIAGPGAGALDPQTPPASTGRGARGPRARGEAATPWPHPAALATFIEIAPSPVRVGRPGRIPVDRPGAAIEAGFGTRIGPITVARADLWDRAA